MSETPVKTYCRAAGLFLILTMFGGWIGEVQIPSQFITGDAATTAARLRLDEQLFRLGFAAYLIEAFSDLVLAWLFYVLLRPVHRDLAMLSAFFGIVSMVLFAVTKMFYFSAPLFLKSKYLSAFSPDQIDGLSGAFISLYGGLSGLFMLFYGTAWIIRGFLTFKSGYLPRYLGALMAIAGMGFFAKNLTKLLAPAYSSDLLLAPMFVNVIVLALWMLAKGVDQAKWDQAVAKLNRSPMHPRTHSEQGAKE